LDPSGQSLDVDELMQIRRRSLEKDVARRSKRETHQCRYSIEPIVTGVTNRLHLATKFIPEGVSSIAETVSYTNNSNRHELIFCASTG
ncbi:MAG: hypothetical protein AAF629_14490, partial [Chloroflexota bacterium]